MNGCIPGSVRGDLVVALKSLYERRDQFDGIIIETTGHADLTPLCQTFFIDEDIQKMYRLDSVIAVINAKHILQDLDEENPEGVENEAAEQIIAFADTILLNNTDLVEGKLVEINNKIKAINNTSTIISCVHSNLVNPRNILKQRAFRLKRMLELDPEFLDNDKQHE